MKWMLVVLVFETAPVKTDLIFDDLPKCLAAEEQVRAAYADAYSGQAQWARQHLSKLSFEEREKFITSRLLRNPATCIPHAALPRISN